MVSCYWMNKLVERAKNPRHWALRCGWTFNPSTFLVAGSIEEMEGDMRGNATRSLGRTFARHIAERRTRTRQ